MTGNNKEVTRKIIRGTATEEMKPEEIAGESYVMHVALVFGVTLQISIVFAWQCSRSRDRERRGSDDLRGYSNRRRGARDRR
jgi:hypothetical protein